MIIAFVKLAGNRHIIEVRNRIGPDVRRGPRETGPTLPHDLAHAAVEAALGIEKGFWGAMAMGVTFAEFSTMDIGRRSRHGFKILKQLSADLVDAEMTVSWAHRVWSGQRQSGRGLRPVGIPADRLAVAIAAIDEAHRRWRGIPEGEVLTWIWRPNRVGEKSRSRFGAGF